MPPKRVYIAENLAAQLSQVYPQKESGLNRAISGFLSLRDLTLRSIRGRFIQAELVGLVDAFNGVFLDLPLPVSPRDMLRCEMADADSMDGSAARHGYDAEALQLKLAQLTEPEAFFLLDELGRFWNVRNDDQPQTGMGFLAVYATE